MMWCILIWPKKLRANTSFPRIRRNRISTKQQTCLADAQQRVFMFIEAANIPTALQPRRSLCCEAAVRSQALQALTIQAESSTALDLAISYLRNQMGQMKEGPGSTLGTACCQDCKLFFRTALRRIV
eukprot:6172734-Amphidinium_carterae.1